MQTVNLGLIKAIFVQNFPPSNPDVLWRDTSLAVPLHKHFNQSTSSWEALINSSIIDNLTIKKGVDGKLYVDFSTVPGLTIENGTITLAKLANVPTGTIFYRKTAGVGVPEVQTLATLKTDLGLTGSNNGDQDLSQLVPNTRKVNNKALSGDIVLTPADIGSPVGSGTSTGTNTGDDTLVTILAKLGITVLSGDNTGDQTASTIPIIDTALVFTAENVEAALLESKLLIDEHTEKLVTLNQNSFTFNLPSGASITQRLLTTVLPSGWGFLAVGDTGKNLQITHPLAGRQIAHITVKIKDVTGTRSLVPYRDAYSGIIENGEVLTIEGFAINELPLTLILTFN